MGPVLRQGKWLWVKCQNGVGAPPILVHFSGDFDVHRGYDLDFDPWPNGCRNEAQCRNLLRRGGKTQMSQPKVPVLTISSGFLLPFSYLKKRAGGGGGLQKIQLPKVGGEAQAQTPIGWVKGLGHSTLKPYNSEFPCFSRGDRVLGKGRELQVLSPLRVRSLGVAEVASGLLLVPVPLLFEKEEKEGKQQSKQCEKGQKDKTHKKKNAKTAETSASQEHEQTLRVWAVILLWSYDGHRQFLWVLSHPSLERFFHSTEPFSGFESPFRRLFQGPFLKSGG